MVAEVNGFSLTKCVDNGSPLSSRVTCDIRESDIAKTGCLKTMMNDFEFWMLYRFIQTYYNLILPPLPKIRSVGFSKFNFVKCIRKSVARVTSILIKKNVMSMTQSYFALLQHWVCMFHMWWWFFWLMLRPFRIYCIHTYCAGMFEILRHRCMYLDISC
jgi:hypothetical protein